MISTFIGLAFGFIAHQTITEEKSILVFRFSFFLSLLIISLTTFIRFSVPGADKTKITFENEIYFTNTQQSTVGESNLAFIALFLSLIITFFFVGQRIAKLFSNLPPLKAYTFDILGSCAGILGFILISFLELPAWTWLIPISCIFILQARLTCLQTIIFGLISASLIFMVHAQDKVLMGTQKSLLPIETYWSPYQKIHVFYDESQIAKITANGVEHQQIENSSSLFASTYDTAYVHRKFLSPELPPYKSVLILGAGSGNDVQMALLNNVESVDAVEIDPVIAKIGAHHNTAHPYSDARVHLHIDDGRAFLSKTKKKYDLIIFALTDSLVKSSGYTQLRLENYLFTLESFERAYELLNESGDIVLYNYYREDWLIDKLTKTLTLATRNPSKLIMKSGDYAIIKIRKDSNLKLNVSEPNLNPPTDDWPFLYLKEKKIPSYYLYALLSIIMGLFIAFGVFKLINAKNQTQTNSLRFSQAAGFFLFGVAFMLLEAKGIIQFSLLFGTVWLNTSLVILAVLILILLANRVSLHVKKEMHQTKIILLLLLSVLVPIFISPHYFLKIENTFVRYLAASLFIFSPIFFANLLFSLNFKNQISHEKIFGWNLLGAMMGVILEYLSMVTGYKALSILIFVLYFMAIILLRTGDFTHPRFLKLLQLLRLKKPSYTLHPPPP